MKLTWSFINEVLSGNEVKSVQQINDGLELTGKNMINYFNECFVNLIPNLISKNNSVFPD